MTITLDKIANGLRSGSISKASVTTEGAGTWHSLWQVAGYPAAGAVPPAFTAGSGYVPTRATTGAFGQANAAGGNELYHALFAANSTVAGSIRAYDRMWHCAVLLTNTTSAQTITTPGTLTAGRDPNSGLDVEPWIEIYTPPGATGATWTLTGTDSTGTTGRTWTYTHPANAETAGQMAPMIPGTAVGGCRVATSLTCSVSSGTAGSVGITLLRPLSPWLSVSTANLASQVLDVLALGSPRIYDDACVAFQVQCTATTSGLWQATVAPSEITP